MSYSRTQRSGGSNLQPLSLEPLCTLVSSLHYAICCKKWQKIVKKFMMSKKKSIENYTKSFITQKLTVTVSSSLVGVDFFRANHIKHQGAIEHHARYGQNHDIVIHISGLQVISRTTKGM